MVYSYGNSAARGFLFCFLFANKHPPENYPWRKLRAAEFSMLLLSKWLCKFRAKSSTYMEKPLEYELSLGECSEMWSTYSSGHFILSWAVISTTLPNLLHLDCRETRETIYSEFFTKHFGNIGFVFCHDVFDGNRDGCPKPGKSLLCKLRQIQVDPDFAHWWLPFPCVIGQWLGVVVL